MAQLSCKLTIFEGPDGSGKSTAAKAFAEATGARYVHFAALPHVNAGLARLYVEAMLPALLGYQDVVFDRCWLSETPYGMAFREGADRLGNASRRMLERLAMRCGAVVVKCDPGWEAIQRSYRARKHLELLDNVEQLALVHHLYRSEPTDLPTVHFDYTVGYGAPPYKAIEGGRFERHPTQLASAGNWGANTVLVGEAFAERKDHDPFYQWPFASFSRAGCSQWLTEQLDTIEYSEADLLWVNADQNLSLLHELCPGRIIALGRVAADKLQRFHLKPIVVAHPQFFKRFGGRVRYPLLDALNGELP